MKVLSLDQVRHIMDFDLFTLEMLLIDSKYHGAERMTALILMKIEGQKRRIEKLDYWAFETESTKDIA